MLQLDTGLGTHFTGLGDVPHTAREAEEIRSQKPSTTLSCPWRLRLNILNAYA